MEITKSSRHSKIIGAFGESAICNWLSRSGFEVVFVDHTGIDIIAYHKGSGQRLGITVKSRTRNTGKEQETVNIFSHPKADRNKLQLACDAFACEPWIAVYVETLKRADIYLTSLKVYDAKYRGKGRVIDVWKMTGKAKKSYAGDSDVRHVALKFQTTHWWSNEEKAEDTGGGALG